MQDMVMFVSVAYIQAKILNSCIEIEILCNLRSKHPSPGRYKHHNPSHQLRPCRLVMNELNQYRMLCVLFLNGSINDIYFIFKHSNFIRQLLIFGKSNERLDSDGVYIRPWNSLGAVLYAIRNQRYIMERVRCEM